ncbi:hypothetical protein ANN_22708 [Periplaneta americana]|uniref:Uncharacterized protein n=1 Tax=Periplaneta americana TaxID=6978 RepID=A0ABQ8S9S8_PERAM|nr:hypothetical protein ANN_22708 [Periplaneta americana]
MQQTYTLKGKGNPGLIQSVTQQGTRSFKDYKHSETYQTRKTRECILKKERRLSQIYNKNTLHLEVRSNQTCIPAGRNNVLHRRSNGHLQPDTNPSQYKCLDERHQKTAELDPAFFHTPAMNEEWKAANFELCQHYTRGAIRGFHYRNYNRKGFHQVSSDCACVICRLHCPLYHLFECTLRTLPRSYYAKDE